MGVWVVGAGQVTARREHIPQGFDGDDGGLEAELVVEDAVRYLHELVQDGDFVLVGHFLADDALLLVLPP